MVGCNHGQFIALVHGRVQKEGRRTAQIITAIHTEMMRCPGCNSDNLPDWATKVYKNGSAGPVSCSLPDTRPLSYFALCRATYRSRLALSWHSAEQYLVSNLRPTSRGVNNFPHSGFEHVLYASLFSRPHASCANTARIKLVGRSGEPSTTSRMLGQSRLSTLAA